MTPTQKKVYEKMCMKERAQFLLGQGIHAKLIIDPKSMEPSFKAIASEVEITPAGFHKTEQEAIEAGTKWLQSKANG